MFIVSCNEVDLARKTMYKCFPLNEAVCEIGVATGINSETILKNANPKVLHLIDPWKFVEEEGYMKDPNNTSNEEGERRYKEVIERFKNEIESGRVVIHRDFSYNVCSKIPDKFFDWILIDAMHTYEGTKRDLEEYKNKIKDSGFLFVHDYTNHELAKKMNFGVVKAVSEFCRENKFIISLIITDVFSSCILTKENNPYSTQLIKNSLEKFRFIIQVKECKVTEKLYVENELPCIVTTIEGKG